MKTYSPFHGLLTAVLWISIVANILSIFRWDSDVEPFTSTFVIIVTLATIAGAFLMLRLNKLGYWLMIVPRLLAVVCGLIGIIEVDAGWFAIINLAQVAFLSLLMLLKKNGMNAYQVLWYDYSANANDNQEEQ